MYKYLTSILLLIFSAYSYANTDNTIPHANGKIDIQQEQHKERLESQKIITQFKQYLQTLSPEMIKEVQEYRKSIAQLNKQKRQLYKKLSKQVQLYLAKEQEFKKKLPIKDKQKLRTLRKQYIQQNEESSVTESTDKPDALISN